MAIKAIIFDCFGVLVGSSEGSLHKSFPEFSEQIYNLDIQANLGEYDKDQFIKKVSEITNTPIEKIFKKQFCDIDNRDRNEPAINLARQIKDEGKYKLGMLSNVGSGWLNKFLTENSIKDLFDAIILSCDVKLIKPDPRIYQLMAKKFGVKPSECVMIDDRPENIDGAESIGMKGIVFRSAAQTRIELDKILEQ